MDEEMKNDFKALVLDTIRLARENQTPITRTEFIKWIPRLVLTYHEIYGDKK